MAFLAKINYVQLVLVFTHFMSSKQNIPPLVYGKVRKPEPRTETRVRKKAEKKYYLLASNLLLSVYD